MAANKIGAIVSFLDEKTPRDTIIHYLEEFKSSLLITYKYSDKRIKDLKRDVKSLKYVINMDGRTVDEAGPDEEQEEDIEYSAFSIPNAFIVGYGLDYDQQGRQLKEVYSLKM